LLGYRQAVGDVMPHFTTAVRGDAKAMAPLPVPSRAPMRLILGSRSQGNSTRSRFGAYSTLGETVNSATKITRPVK